MILCYPVYYKKFHCIADRCEDTCCAGWEIDIDDKSFEYYKNVPGTFGDRLRMNIQEYRDEEEDIYESHGFILSSDRRCPFLNGEGLCDLYRELGEEALCSVCTDTPRNMLEYGGVREIAISAACPEAARLIYGSEKPVAFVEEEIAEEQEFEESDDERFFAGQIRFVRNQVISLLQNRRYSLPERILTCFCYVEKIQDCINRNEINEIKKIMPQWDENDFCRGDSKIKYEFFLQRMTTYSSLAPFREDWNEVLSVLYSRYAENEEGAWRYAKESELWKKHMKEEKAEYEYEHLLVYYTFMCMARCVDDYDLIGRMKLSVASFLMIRDMEMAWFFLKGKGEKSDRLYMRRLYAKEVEHSEENLALLLEDFLFESAYNTENLLLSL